MFSLVTEDDLKRAETEPPEVPRAQARAAFIREVMSDHLPGEIFWFHGYVKRSARTAF